jgi:hypothetical protein
MASISYRSLRQVGGGRLSALGDRPGELAGVCSTHFPPRANFAR